MVDLFRASESGDDARVEKLLADGDNPEATDKYGNTPLMLSCEYGHSKCVALLLKHNASVSAINKNGEHSLLFASATGQTHCAKLLLDARANANTPDCEQITPLMRASQFGHSLLVKLLCDRGADVTMSTSLQTETALMFAARAGKFSVVKQLLVRITLCETALYRRACVCAHARRNHAHLCRLLLLPATPSSLHCHVYPLVTKRRRKQAKYGRQIGAPDGHGKGARRCAALTAR